MENKLLKNVGKDVDCYKYMTDAVMELLLGKFDNNNFTLQLMLLLLLLVE